MGWREVVIETPCKISTSGNYLIVRKDDVNKIHLSEIHYLMIACPSVSITGVALCELSKFKIKIVFCDEKHLPYGELVSYYGCHNSSKKIQQQIAWDKNCISSINTMIIYQKIKNQAKLLEKLGFSDRAKMLLDFADEIELDDVTNREGHAAKVYFNTLFGMDFNRDLNSNINSALNYGYTIILSCISREIVANGCITQLGVNHKNEFNHFNFSCDIIEPFRIIVDEYVYEHQDNFFDKDYKHGLVGLLNKQVMLGNELFLHNAIAISVKSVIDSLNNNDTTLLKLYEFA